MCLFSCECPFNNNKFNIKNTLRLQCTAIYISILIIQYSYFDLETVSIPTFTSLGFYLGLKDLEHVPAGSGWDQSHMALVGPMMCNVTTT